MDLLRAAGIFLGILVGLAVAILLYFLPTIVAAKRHVLQRRTIGWLNLFFGWTTVGWVILMIIASLAKSHDWYRPVHRIDSQD